MSTRRLPGDTSERARTAGSSLAISLAVVAIVLLILAGGGYLIFRGDGDDDNGLAAIPSPEGTSELVDLGATPTPDDDATATTFAPTQADDPTATRPAPTASPTTEATETEPAEEEPTSTDVEEEPSSTPEPEEPEPTSTPEAEPTETPLEGEFGFLPAAQLPSGGAAASLQLEYQLGMSLESLPTTGTVYLLSWPSYTLADVELARDQLALQGEVIEEGVGVFRVESARGTLYVSPSEIIFRAAGFTEGEGLPDDASAIAIAQEWIALSAFLGGEMDAGQVVARDEDAQRVIVKFRPAWPQPNLAPNPAATVTIGPGGTVLEVRIAWPAGMASSEYGFSDPLAVWQAVQSGQGFLEADITSVMATGALSGTATIVDYSTAYTLAGSPAGDQFLVPVIRFEGSARIDQTGDEIPVSVSIPVVWAEQGTAG